jgi:hypothetical protein
MAVATVESMDTVKAKAAGAWTAVGTFVLLVAITIASGGYVEAFSALLSFMTFDTSSILGHDGLSIAGMGVLTAFLVIDVLACVMLLCIMRCMRVQIPNSGLSFDGLFGKSDMSFAKIIAVIAVEELFARALFLGLFGMWFQGEVATYVLFLLGNGLWALVHLTNFKKKEDRKIWLVLPQFIGGIILSVVFLAYGFLAALLVHIAFDMVIFSMHKRDVPNWRTGIVVIYDVAALVLGLCFVWSQLPDLAAWTQLDGSFVINGWSFWDYFWALVVGSAALSIVGELLLFDNHDIDDDRPGVIRYAAGVVLVLVLMMGVHFLLGFVIADTLSRLIVASALVLFLTKTRGGSHLARIFWIGLPSAMLLMCAVLALGFWWGMLLLGLTMLVELPQSALRRRLEMAK